MAENERIREVRVPVWTKKCYIFTDNQEGGRRSPKVVLMRLGRNNRGCEQKLEIGIKADLNRPQRGGASVIRQWQNSPTPVWNAGTPNSAWHSRLVNVLRSSFRR